VYANGKIYLAGGYDGSNTLFKSLYIYDVAGNSWSRGADLPAERVAGYAGAYNGKIYYAGGASDANFTPASQTWEYTIATNSWATKGTMPAANSNGASAVIGQYLYTFGGLGQEVHHVDAGGLHEQVHGRRQVHAVRRHDVVVGDVEGERKVVAAPALDVERMMSVEQ
jgi:N-acetylneuraminic acid mutarotase